MNKEVKFIVFILSVLQAGFGYGLFFSGWRVGGMVACVLGFNYSTLFVATIKDFYKNDLASYCSIFIAFASAFTMLYLIDDQQEKDLFQIVFGIQVAIWFAFVVFFVLRAEIQRRQNNKIKGKSS